MKTITNTGKNQKIIRKVREESIQAISSTKISMTTLYIFLVTLFLSQGNYQY